MTNASDEYEDNSERKKKQKKSGTGGSKKNTIRKNPTHKRIMGFTCIYSIYLYKDLSLSLQGNIHHVNTKVCVCNVTTLHSPPPAMLHQDFFFKKRVPVHMLVNQ